MCSFFVIVPFLLHIFLLIFLPLLSSMLRWGKDMRRNKKDMKEGILNGKKKNVLYENVCKLCWTHKIISFQNL